MKRFLKYLSVFLIAILVGGAFILWTPDTDPAEMKAKYTTVASQFIDVDGMKMHVRDEGPRDAPVIVLIHGSSASLHTWDPWTVAFAKTHRVIRFDVAGHGLTGPHPKRDYSVESFIRAVNGVTRKLGVERFTIGGNSMGGGIALVYALAHPERLDGLILVDAVGAPQVPTSEKPRLEFRIAQTPILRDIGLYVTPRSFVEQGVHAALSVDSIITPEMVDLYWELLRYPGNRQATVDRLSAKYPDIEPNKIRALKIPTLIVWGEEDTYIKFMYGQWFAKNIPGSKLISYKGVGHAPMEEVADKSAQDVLDWMASAKIGAVPFQNSTMDQHE